MKLRHQGVVVLVVGIAAPLGVLVGAEAPQQAGTSNPQTPGGPRCRVVGHIKSGAVPLPGVSVLVQAGDVVKAATSTDTDGRYTIAFSPNASYHIAADLTGFARAERDVTLAEPPCDTTADFQLALKPRREPPATGAPAAGAPEQPAGQPVQASRGLQAGQPGQRFRTLGVQADPDTAAALESASIEDGEDVTRLLPPGFSAQTAQADAIAVDGRSDATSLDRGLLNDRQQIIRLGQLDPATGQFAAGFGPQDGFRDGPGGQGFGGSGAGAGFGGPGGRGGGPGGRGGFGLAGRGARGQSPYQGTTMYTFGGSALDTAPYQLRPDVPVTQPEFSQNTFGTTFGGPLKIPGLYEDTNRRTNFQVNYTGNHSSNVFDQYATVPTPAMRSGDFSGSAVQLIDPSTGQPFPGNQIPASRLDPGAVFLAGFMPLPNLPGTSQNYHVSTTALSTSDAVSLRLTQNLSSTVVQGGRGGFGGRGGGAGGFGRRGGPAGRGTSVVLSAQLQYRRNDTQALNVFPDLGSHSTSSSLAVPISLNVVRGRTIQNFTINFTRAKTESTNAFSDVEDVGQEAGIGYPSPTDPFNWGVPTLAFSAFNSVRGPAASARTDSRTTASYFWSHPIGKHQLRLGGDYRFDTTTSESNANARGSFTFTGLYSAAGSPLAGRNGADFADFLLGAPQQATLQVGGVTDLHGKAVDAYVEDNWQRSAKLTFNLGLRYELVMPYVEVDGRMANLDAAPGFLGVAPVVSGESGPYTGVFPAGLIDTDVNNIGPRVGFAYRAAPGTVLRGGYSITYNPGSYAAIARQLVAQPPFAETETVLGSASVPLTLSDALLSSQPATTMNNYGVDCNYSLGQIQTWNGGVTKNLTPVWAVVANYTGVKGTDLDLLSAPNRSPSGLLIPSVQPFIWESSGGHSILHAGNFQLIRRLANGVSGSVSYTLARSMDNTPSLGAGGTVVAQNPGDPASEWALSNFDRRQQLSSNLFVELPFGPNRHWLRDGGVMAGIFGGWSASLAFTAQTGAPLTARVVGATGDVLRGTNGSLRADYTGGPIEEAAPTTGAFFNTAAFAVPAAGVFGDSARNMITGPGGHQLNGMLSRDMRLGGNRAITLQVNALNVLNTAQWASVDTNINSPTFGQVVAVRPMRSITANVRFRF